jgi:hypothetical protein
VVDAAEADFLREVTNVKRLLAIARGAIWFAGGAKIKQRTLPASSVLALIVCLLLTGGVLAQAVPAAAVVRPQSARLAVRPGQIFVVNLYVDNVTNLYAADVHLSYDPALLQVLDADPNTDGVQIQPLSTFLAPDFVIKKKACNVVDPSDPDCAVAGTVRYAVTQTNPRQPVSGSGPLAAVTFQALALGTSPLTISPGQCSLSGTGGATIAATCTSSQMPIMRPNFLPLVLKPR